MPASDFPGTHSDCYVAFGRRYTVDNGTAGILVYQSGDLVTVPNDVVTDMVEEGILLPPGQPYSAPAGMADVSHTGFKGMTKSKPAPSPQLASYPVAPPASASKQITLPSAPTDPASLSVQVGQFTYLGPAIASVVGAVVTMTIVMFPTDRIIATYR